MKRSTKTAPKLPQTVAALFNGKMTPMDKPFNPDRANFVIMCEYGDWSGFRTLADCEKQYPELEANKRPNFFYYVQER